MTCRHCGAALTLPLIDLGSAPPSNAYLTEATLRAPEKWFPLRVLVCELCWLVQTEDFADAEELFNAEYAYFSSVSPSWRAHAGRYVAAMAERYGLDGSSHVVEVAANDGYLLEFVKERDIPCTGIEPTASTAAAARGRGIPVVEDFFGVRLAEELKANGREADLMVANNVLAHVPAINDFVAGFTILLKPAGVATFEFPHVLRLIAGSQFDTIYHEHFSYLSLTAVDRIFRENGLAVFAVEEIPTHGGSLRVFAQRCDAGVQPRDDSVDALLEREREAGVTTRSFYEGFQARAEEIKDAFVAFLLETKRKGQTVAGYGAAAKGNTLLNYAGVKGDLIRFVIDRSPGKQGKFLPGSRIPIVLEDRLEQERPDVIVILPWNLKEEIAGQLAFTRDWGARFVTAVPHLEIL